MLLTVVTQGPWGCSFDTSSQEPGVVTLAVYRVVNRATMKFAYGDHHGRKFPSTEAAKAFALERGYVVRWFTSPVLRARRVARGRRAS